MMPKMLLVLFFVFFVKGMFWAGEIMPEIPIEVSKPAVKIVDYSIVFTPSTIEVKLNYYDVDSKIVKEAYLTIDGNDFTTLINKEVQVSHVGQKFSNVMFKAIRNKCKDKLGITGTVN